MILTPPAAAAAAVLSIGAVWTGYRVFRTDSMVRASFLLLASFLCVGGISLLLFAEYLGLALMFMMAVEMTVMAIFMVAFMMNPAGLNPMQMVHQPRVAATAGWFAFLALTAVVWLVDWPDHQVAEPADATAELGHELMGGSMLIFESAGVTLLAAMIVAIALSSHRNRYGTSLEGSVPPPLDPATGEPASPEPEGGGGHAHHGHGGGHEEDGPRGHDGHHGHGG